MKNRTVAERPLRCYPKRCAIHSPTASGIRVTAEMGNYAKTLYEVPGPLIVIEDEGKFLGITWEPWNPRIGHTKPDIEVDEEKWHITFPEGTVVRDYPPTGSLEKAVLYYRREHPQSPAPGKGVLDRIKRCITLDMWLPGGRIAHNYADACQLLKKLEKLNIAKDTLLYIPGWHAPYDTRMPAWEPANGLGGHQGFRELIELSKLLGVIVIPHMNFWGYSKASGLLENWEEVFTGEGWSSMTELGPASPPIEYMQIDHPHWMALFDSYFDKTVGEFGLESVFLDQCGNAFDNPKGDLVAATRGLLERIHRKFPDLLIGAEVLSEHIVDHVPLIQATWIMEQNIGKFSPITKFMFQNRVRFVPHLFLAAAVPCRYVCTNTPLIIEHGVEKTFQWYQENNRLLGGIPSVRLDYNRHGIDPVSRKVLEET